MRAIRETAKKTLYALDTFFPTLFKWRVVFKKLDEGTQGMVVFDTEKLKAVVYLSETLTADSVVEVCCHEWAHLLAPTEAIPHGPLWGAAYGILYGALLP